MCVCVCVRACARACVCTYIYTHITYIHVYTRTHPAHGVHIQNHTYTHMNSTPYIHAVPKMKQEGVTHVLNMVAEWGGPERCERTVSHDMFTKKKVCTAPFTCQYACVVCWC